MLAISNEERSSMCTTDKDGDIIPPCETPFKTVKYDDISTSHLIHNESLLYQNINILTT